MTGKADLLTATEAAFVSDVPLRDVNRAIDEKILPDDFYDVGRGRQVRAAGCSLIAFYFGSAKRLTSEERLSAIRVVGPRLRKSAAALAGQLTRDWTVRDEFLTIDLAPFLRKALERLGRLAEARALVVTSPDVLSGTPVIRGTRVPVYDVAASAAAGLPRDRILGAYPSLDADKIELTVIYAEVNPPRGRPRRSPELPKGSVIVTERRVPRRWKTG